MKSIKIVLSNLKKAGVEQAEVICVKAFEAIENSLPEIAVDPETSPVEKGAASILATVVPVLKPHIEKLVDFDKDGKVG